MNINVIFTVFTLQSLCVFDSHVEKQEYFKEYAGNSLIILAKNDSLLPVLFPQTK